MRHLLHTHEFVKQQRLLGLVKLLGELYNDLVVDSPIIFDMLYTFISAGNDRVGPMPDPPADFARVRLVCALLDTCGHYFDRGTTKKKLDVFLGHFQRYLLGKVRDLACCVRVVCALRPTTPHNPYKTLTWHARASSSTAFWALAAKEIEFVLLP